MSLMKVKVKVMPKSSVFDPQGEAVAGALRQMGLEGLNRVRVGKWIELEFEGKPELAKVEEAARDLLSNPVIEEYELLG